MGSKYESHRGWIDPNILTTFEDTNRIHIAVTSGRQEPENLMIIFTLNELGQSQISILVAFQHIMLELGIIEIRNKIYIQGGKILQMILCH